MTHGTTYLCIEGDKFFTKDKIYKVWDEDNNGVIDDQGDFHEILLGDFDCWGAAGDSSCFESLNNPEDSFTTPEEEEEFQRIDQKQSEQFVDCPVAIAHHIHQIQKWLKHIRCSSEAEFRISSDYVWASPDEFVTYEAKEGGVGTLIEYMRQIGGVNSCLKKMEDVG